MISVALPEAGTSGPLRRCVGNVDDFVALRWGRLPAHYRPPGGFDDLLLTA
ncbi:MAG: hypothetical protein ACRDZ7_23145 [Acidimicrobiia bacterium]